MLVDTQKLVAPQQFSSFFFMFLRESLVRTMKKVLFDNFQVIFIVFDHVKCERIRKHAFAGRNTQQMHVLH